MCNPIECNKPYYYLPDDKITVTDKDDLRKAKIDDCVCGNCDTHNPVTRDFCIQCGHVLTKQLDKVNKDTYQMKEGYKVSDIIGEGDVEIDKTFDERYNDSNAVYDWEQVPLPDEVKPKVVIRPKPVPKKPDTSTPWINIPPPPKGPSIRHISSSRAAKWTSLFIVAVALIAVNIWAFSTQEIDVTAESFSWSSMRTTEDYKTLNKADWKLLVGSYDVRSRNKLHHHEDSLTGYETVYYTVREVVGTETYEDPYTVQVECGQESYQDCKTVRNQCGTTTETYNCGTEVCGHKINSNGFAEDVTCPKQCTRQVPKYCNEQECETKYRTKYCPEIRYKTKTRDAYGDVQKSKQVAKYKSVPRYQTWYTYKVDRWVKGRSVSWGGNTRYDFNEFPDESTDIRRMSKAHNDFFIRFKATAKEEKTFDAVFPKSFWSSMDSSLTYRARVNRMGKFELILE